MLRETKYLGIILKKQPYLEGDEIITFFTREQGKVRALAKSVKLPKSRLQQRLQSLFVVNLTLSHGKMPKIISVEPVEVFAGLRGNLPALKMAFYAVELVLKFTPDEHPNAQLYNTLVSFLSFMDKSRQEGLLNAALIKFKLAALDALGFDVQNPAAPSPNLYFSSSQGGFTVNKTVDGIAVAPRLYEIFSGLKTSSWEIISEISETPSEILELQNLLSSFIEYQLERKLKSEKYLRSA